MESHWTLAQLLGYLRTWSATQRFIAARHYDPVVLLGGELRNLWQPDSDVRSVRWPLSLRVGKVLQ